MQPAGNISLTMPRDSLGGECGFDLEEAAEALSLPFQILDGGRVSFRTADVPALRAWAADRRAVRLVEPSASSRRPKRKRLSPYEQATEDQRRKDEAERQRRDSLPPSPLPSKRETVPTAAVNLNECPRQHPIAIAVNAVAELLANGVTKRGSSQSPPPKAKPQTSALEEFRALVSAKLEARIQERRRFNHKAELSSGDVLRAQADVHKEYPAIRQRLIDEKNAGKAGYGMASRRVSA